MLCQKGLKLTLVFIINYPDDFVRKKNSIMENLVIVQLNGHLINKQETDWNNFIVLLF